MPHPSYEIENHCYRLRNHVNNHKILSKIDFLNADPVSLQHNYGGPTVDNLFYLTSLKKTCTDVSQ